MSPLDRALERAAAGERLGREEAASLAAVRDPGSLHRLGRAALVRRRALHGDRATWVRNLQVNPSNLCEGGCDFCRYAARPGDEHAYVLTQEEILARVSRTDPREVHIVGGLNREWTLERYLDLLIELRRLHPDLFLKAFTAVEVDWFAREAARSPDDVLAELKEAGLNGLTGGGAELFSPRVRRELCPEKLSPGGYLAIHQAAHRLELPTNATMLFGLGESPAERAEHLLALRSAQDETGGFRCFIPLPYQAGEEGRSPPPAEILAVTALARLVLDNFPHIKAYWPMTGLETAAAALSWGADDLDGTLGRERIAHAAGAATPEGLAGERLVETIRLGGFQPVERDGAFRPVPEEAV